MDLAAVRGIEQTSELFRWKLVQVARALGIDPDWLASVISFESAGTFSPSQTNRAGSGAIGLIQFMPSTAQNLGTSTAELAAMTAEDQLDYVAAYFQGFAGRLHTLSDTYLAVLFPAAIGKAGDHVVWNASDANPKPYQQNRGFDVEGKGFITVADMTRPVAQVYANAQSRPRIDVPDDPPTGPPDPLAGAPTPSAASLGAGALAGTLIAFAFFRRQQRPRRQRHG